MRKWAKGCMPLSVGQEDGKVLMNKRLWGRRQSKRRGPRQRRPDCNYRVIKSKKHTDFASLKYRDSNNTNSPSLPHCPCPVIVGGAWWAGLWRCPRSRTPEPFWAESQSWRTHCQYQTVNYWSRRHHSLSRCCPLYLQIHKQVSKEVLSICMQPLHAAFFTAELLESICPCQECCVGLSQ